jgi:hypothetical protein
MTSSHFKKISAPWYAFSASKLGLFCFVFVEAERAANHIAVLSG